MDSSLIIKILAKIMNRPKCVLDIRHRILRFAEIAREAGEQIGVSTYAG